MARWSGKLFAAMALIVGVTAVSYLLLVRFGTDPSYALAGPHASPERIAEIRRELGLDRTWLGGYVDYLRQLLSLDLGHSMVSGEPVLAILARTLPISIGLTLPGFLIGNALGIALAMQAVRHRGRWLDRAIMAMASVTMSISFVVIILALQILLCTPYGLDWFPVRGWAVEGIASYLRHATVPTLALILVSIGYNTRFYRSVLAEEAGKDHVFAQRALGLSRRHIEWHCLLPNAMMPILTRLLFSAPLVVVGGSLLIESQFGIPGIGKATFDALTDGDRTVLKAVIGLTAVLFAIATVVADALYRAIDPRLETP